MKQNVVVRLVVRLAHIRTPRLPAPLARCPVTITTYVYIPLTKKWRLRAQTQNDGGPAPLPAHSEYNRRRENTIHGQLFLLKYDALFDSALSIV